MSANQLSLQHLREFAPTGSPLLAYRIESTGSPMHDWAKHIAAHDLYRRDLEETSVLGGNLVVRAAEGDEKPALERVKILSLSYASRVFGNVDDAKEFVRCAKAIADPEATQYELEQIASYYYRECRTRNVSEVLKEMAFLGMEMTLVTADSRSLETDFTETYIGKIKLTPADLKRVRRARKALPPLPPSTPNFDSELRAIEKRLARQTITKANMDEFSSFYLSDEGKSMEELDEDFRRFDAFEQYTEDGLLGLQMSGSSHTEVVLELDAEVSADYLPEAVQPLAKLLGLIFVGFEIGGRPAQAARHFIACRNIERQENRRAREAFRLNLPFIETTKPSPHKFSISPLSNAEISEWIDCKLDTIYDREVARNIRRLHTQSDGNSVEITVLTLINPDFEEKQYAREILHLLTQQMERDFHLQHLRQNEVYQNIYLRIRRTKDTAHLTATAETARRAKEEKRLSLKEYTTLSTVAKSQFARLLSFRPSLALYSLEKEIKAADSRKIGYLKWALYGKNQPAHPIHSLPKQEVQRAWTSLRSRELELKQLAIQRSGWQQPRLQFGHPAKAATQIKVTPVNH